MLSQASATIGAMSDHWSDTLRRLGDVTPGDGNNVSIVLKTQNRPGLEFTKLPSDAVVTLTGRDARDPLDVTGAHGEQQLVVRLSVTLNIRTDLAQVKVTDLAPRSSVTVSVDDEQSVDRLVVDCSGTVKVEQGSVTTAEVRAGQLQGGADRFGTIELAGDATVPSEVARLRITSESAVLRGSRQLDIAELSCTVPSKEAPTLEMPQSEQGARKVAIGDVASRVRLVPQKEVTVTVGGNTSAFEVGGRGVFEVPPGATVTDVALIEPVSTSVARDAALLRVTGDLRVRSCANASILAAPGGQFAYRGIASGNTRSGKATGVENATLRGVRIESDAVGRRHLRELAGAAVVEPQLDDLPAFGQWRIPLVRQRLTQGDERRRELNDTALFIQELAGLVEQRCGSGSIRTKAAWAAYRARQLDSSSWGERLALGLFRLVGYGQRPGPPLLAWLLLAAGLTPLFFMMDSSDSWIAALPTDIGSAITTLWPQFVELLLSPLILLRLAGDPTLTPVDGPGELLMVLLRTVIAAPFVFFVVATSRFLRADWISASFRGAG